MGGIFTNSIISEMQARARGRLAYGTYTKRFCQKESMIHLAVMDSLGVKNVREDNRRCTCGGYTFTSVWGGDKIVCRHCGKQYFRKEFAALPVKKLESAERENRRIFAMLLNGGDLREDKERNVLILKDANGVHEGELPLEFAAYIEGVFQDAKVVVSVRNDGVKNHAISLHMAPAGV